MGEGRKPGKEKKRQLEKKVEKGKKIGSDENGRMGME